MLSGGRHIALDGKMGEKRFDLGFSHVLEMAFAMKQNEPFGSDGIGLLSADAVMPDTDCIADLVEKSGLASLRGMPHASIILENIHGGCNREWYIRILEEKASRGALFNTHYDLSHIWCAIGVADMWQTRSNLLMMKQYADICQ